MSWRRFHPHVEHLARECFRDLFREEIFEITGRAVGEGSVAFPVKLNESGLLAYVKPANVGLGNLPTAAHEKIASDLGYALGLPVAPVQLSRKIKRTGLPTVVALSFTTLAQPKPWREAAATLSGSQREAMRSMFSAMFAFHCWINDFDHNWNDDNALFEITLDGQISAVFFDYGHSLTRGWKPPAPLPDRGWDVRRGPNEALDNSEILRAIDRIVKFPVNQLESIIRRIPSECLPPPTGEALVSVLDARRSELGKLLKLEGAS